MTTTPIPHPTLPPNVQVLGMINQLWVVNCLYVAAKYNLADILGDEPLSADDVAARSGMHPDWAYRLLRALASIGVFQKEPGRIFSNTPLSHCLREDHPQSLKAMVLTTLSPRSMSMWANFEQIVTTTGVTVPEHIWGQSFYELLDARIATLPVPSVALEPRPLFDGMLRAIAALTDTPIAQAYPFAGTVCDLGGSDGSLLTAILRHHPDVHALLFERPAVVEFLKEKESDHPFELVAGNFFDSVPGADIYILKEVFHNWPDEQAASILRNCQQANPQATILVIEQLVENPHGFAPLLDICMGVEQRGRERSRDEYAWIGACAGYTLSNVYSTRSTHSLLQFQLDK